MKRLETRVRKAFTRENLYDLAIPNSFIVRNLLLLLGSDGKPFPSRHHSPNGLDDSKRPGPLQEAISRTQQAGEGECQDEPGTAVLQRVGDQHGRHGEKAE